jgi:mannose-1-phosphate guanylyltransferase/mannose-6-phosphate isomerase
MQSIFGVIMCGGVGSRLWPASRPSAPKQFLPLLGEKTLLQETIERVEPLKGLRGLVLVGSAQHVDLLKGHLAGIRIPHVILLEPEARDSAPAMAAATHWIHRQDPGAVGVFLASDHHIPEGDLFREALAKAVGAARSGSIVTLGIAPSEPSTQYGYIKPGERMDESDVRRVAIFREKPDSETAKRYVDEGFFWNSGNFVSGVSTLIDEFDAHVTGLNQSVSQALSGGLVDGNLVYLGPAFRSATKISIDFAVMEKTERAAVVPVSLAWSDLGAWDAVWEHADKDGLGNAAAPDHVLISSEGCLIHAEPGVTVAGIGLKDVAIVVQGGSVLVTSKRHAQHVKTAAQRVHLNGYAHRPADVRSELIAESDKLRNWLMFQALPLWATIGTDHAGWGFHETVAPNGVPSRAVRRARVQARQIYSFATAGSLGWAGPWRDLVLKGVSDFCRRYKRSDGLFRTLVDPSGQPVDDTPMLYDQAFSLLALAAAQPTIPDIEAQALELLGSVRTAFGHEAGGFRENGAVAFQSNPHMHLLEASLAWMNCGRAKIWSDVASEVVRLALNKFIHPETGLLREFFAADWVPAEGLNGFITEPGHQFEWAWLLFRWHEITGDTAAKLAAKRLVMAGQKGVDRHRNVAINQMSLDGVCLSAVARLWPQTERLKAYVAALKFDEVDLSLGDSMDGALNAARSLFPYLATPVRGLWFDKMKSDGRFETEPAPASSLYHIICAIEQLGVAVDMISNDVKWQAA